MTEKDILDKLLKEYPVSVNKTYPFPETHEGKLTIKAIILGADPTHIVNDEVVPMKKVFGLHLPKSPYWRSIQRNLDQLPGLSLDNIYVQNLCRNYFKNETTKNKNWLEIARKYWIPFLKEEMDSKFDSSVPVLMTTEFILNAVLKDGERKVRAEEMYENNIIIAADRNLMGRELVGFYRHYVYVLNKNLLYRDFLVKKYYSQ